MELLGRIWDGIIGFISILLPFGKGPKIWHLGPTGRWVLHFVLLILILVGLFFLNGLFFRTDVRAASVLRSVWLPLLFLLVYLALWTGWWIWKLLRAEPEASNFPDIDAAWDEAVRALAHVGVRPGDLPLFLVLGRPSGPEEALFDAAQLNLVVKQAPAGLAPLHVYATREALYVTCAGASLLGKHAANVALEGIDELAGGTVDPAEGYTEDATIRAKGKAKDVILRLKRTIGRPMNVIERRASRRDAGMPMPDLLKNPSEMELYRARFAHLCRLIVQSREPFCPINGVLVLVPIGGTDTPQDAQQTAELCARDLATARRVLKMECPVLALTCDLEALPGFGEFMGRVPAKDRLGRLGQRFPLAPPDLAGEDLEEQIDKSIHNLCNNYLRDWVYRLFHVNGGEKGDGTGTVASNTGLYLFLDEMRARKKNLSRVLTQGIAKNAPTPLLFAGCYLAGTGPDKAHEQAFVAGVFKRLSDAKEDLPSKVFWTDEAITEDRKAHSRASLGYMLLGGLTILVVVALVGFLILR